MDSTLEAWKDVTGFEGLYQVSNLGRIKSFLQNRKELKPAPNKSGYLKVVLRRDGRSFTLRVNRIVAIAFIPNPDHKPEVNHKNGNKLDNNVGNLEWNTRLENQRHAIDNGFKIFQSKQVAQYTLSNKLVSIFKNSREANTKTSLDRRMINRACRGARPSYAGFKWAYL